MKLILTLTSLCILLASVLAGANPVDLSEIFDGCKRDLLSYFSKVKFNPELIIFEQRLQKIAPADGTILDVDEAMVKKMKDAPKDECFEWDEHMEEALSQQSCMRIPDAASKEFLGDLAKNPILLKLVGVGLACQHVIPQRDIVLRGTQVPT